jgi:hypothetical protein
MKSTKHFEKGGEEEGGKRNIIEGIADGMNLFKVYFKHLWYYYNAIVGASLDIFLGFSVSGIHLGFPSSSFLLVLQSCKLPASSAMFPVTVTTL